VVLLIAYTAVFNHTIYHKHVNPQMNSDSENSDDGEDVVVEAHAQKHGKVAEDTPPTPTAPAQKITTDSKGTNYYR